MNVAFCDCMIGRPVSSCILTDVLVTECILSCVFVANCSRPVCFEQRADDCLKSDQSVFDCVHPDWCVCNDFQMRLLRQRLIWLKILIIIKILLNLSNNGQLSIYSTNRIKARFKKHLKLKPYVIEPNSQMILLL